MPEPSRPRGRRGAGALLVRGSAAALAIGLATSGLAAERAGPDRARLQLAQAQPEGGGSDAAQDATGSGGIFAGGGGAASDLLHVPVVNLYPGGVRPQLSIKNPVADDPEAVQRGMDYFTQMNCVGCHAPNGAGGMGPALSNAKFVYGGEPENIYLTILQGRPKGMPAWGGMLPDQVIWDLVAYIGSISKEPAGPWGKTTSADGFTIEQMPAEFQSTTEPWRFTTPFSYGQAPFEQPKGSPPRETPK
jgi:cytochrome c oxidase cbb3-type subunit III